MIFGTEAKKPIFRILFLLFAVSILPSCDETPPQGEKSKVPKTKVAGFAAVITGSYEGKVSGTGVLVLLPNAGFEKQGYFFLADAQGIRPHGVTFILPRGLAPGKHILGSPSPLAIGTMPSVRVDRDMGNSVLSADRNTSGFVDLTAFPDDAGKLSGSDVVGSFEFQTEDPKGQKITVKGKFSFKAK
jgi:hypothetical protein